MRTRRGRAVLVAGVALLALLLTLGSGALAIMLEPGNLRATFDASFAPKALHKFGFTPGALRLSTQFETLDGSHPPALKELVWETDRNVKLDVRGLPVCPYPPKIRTWTYFLPSNESEMCPDAIVGRGRAEIKILFEESSEISADSAMTVYNAGLRNGKPTLFARVHITKPVAASVLFEIKLKPIHSGRFRTAMAFSIPKSAGGAGSVANLSMRLSKQVRAPHRTASFVSLRCSDGRIATRATATFGDGTRLQAAPIQRACVAR